MLVLQIARCEYCNGIALYINTTETLLIFLNIYSACCNVNNQSDIFCTKCIDLTVRVGHAIWMSKETVDIWHKHVKDCQLLIKYFQDEYLITLSSPHFPHFIKLFLQLLLF